MMMSGSNKEMHVAGVVVRCTAGRLLEVLQNLSDYPEVEVHQTQPASSLLVATVETSGLQEQVDATKALLDIPGVMDVDLVYHAFDSAPCLEEVCAS